ncbi:TPA: hypothetical protein ACU16Q_001012 [Pasteurella multocida]|uniref:hypothetical protein n=1 Tax=Pasteurella multocida TaxID=747 RepID=UPI003982412F
MNVIEQVRRHIAETGVTQTRIAKEAGLSAGALSAYLSESYKGNVEEVEAKLTAYFERLAQKLREFIEAPSFIETKTATQIFSTLRFAQNANVLNAGQNKRLKRSTLISRADAFCEGWVIGVYPPS